MSRPASIASAGRQRRAHSRRPRSWPEDTQIRSKICVMVEIERLPRLLRSAGVRDAARVDDRAAIGAAVAQYLELQRMYGGR
jgi:hypothetical protein